jgi:RNA polymerase sigma-70 factor (ECF subfamily)
MKNLTLESDHGFADEMLMDELVQHDAHALEALYGKYRPVLRGVVLRIVNDELDADDVLQEVFLQLWTRADNYSAAKGKPLGWLITLARRRAIDRLRQRLAYRRATDRFELESRHPATGSNDGPAFGTAAFQDDIQALVRSAMDRLPPKQRVVVEQAFLAGMSQRAIAAEMEIPLGTVKTRIDLGLRKLASVLASSRRKIF